MNPGEVVAAILSKEFDDDLLAIRDAVSARLNGDELAPAWEVTFDDQVMNLQSGSPHQISIGEAIGFQDMRSREVYDADPRAVLADRFALVIARMRTLNPDKKLDELERMAGVLQIDDVKVREFIGPPVPKDD